MRRRVLDALKRSKSPVSGQALADELKVSRTAVWKQVQKFRSLGYDIVGSPKIGYALMSAPDIIVCEELEALLPAEFKGRVVCADRIGSTNDAAKDLAAAGSFKPVGLVVAEEQTEGRGRFGRRWVSPGGGIWMSLVVRPQIPVVAAGRVAILAAVAVAEAIAEVAEVQAWIKWPNDVMVDGKKVCGILTEMAAEFALVEYLVIGIGVNANIRASKLAQGPGVATTLMAASGGPVDRTALISALVTRIVAALPALEDGFGAVRERWKELSETLGRQVKLDAGGSIIEGRAADIDADGALIVETTAGERRVFRAGEVTMGNDDKS
ncbi:MAG: biotin--[acetyl-CoA-carboxylase] ligase [Actinomycetota bacterium]|nr:biotin--[acetyl-CoA-carboxylase] ligase [Actinomycetota bacterium]